MFLFKCYELKNPAFEEEKEWRLQSFLGRHLNSDGTIENGFLQHMDFNAKSDRIVPFLEIPLEEIGVPPIREVIVGPKNITPTAYVSEMLRMNDFEFDRVIKSTASYR